MAFLRKNLWNFYNFARFIPAVSLDKTLQNGKSQQSLSGGCCHWWERHWLERKTFQTTRLRACQGQFPLTCFASAFVFPCIWLRWSSAYWTWWKQCVKSVGWSGNPVMCADNSGTRSQATTTERLIALKWGKYASITHTLCSIMRAEGTTAATGCKSSFLLKATISVPITGKCQENMKYQISVETNKK